jgi:hypothetical protein
MDRPEHPTDKLSLSQGKELIERIFDILYLAVEGNREVFDPQKQAVVHEALANTSSVAEDPEAFSVLQEIEAEFTRLGVKCPPRRYFYVGTAFLVPIPGGPPVSFDTTWEMIEAANEKHAVNEAVARRVRGDWKESFCGRSKNFGEFLSKLSTTDDCKFGALIIDMEDCHLCPDFREYTVTIRTAANDNLGCYQVNAFDSEHALVRAWSKHDKVDEREALWRRNRHTYDGAVFRGHHQNLY